MCLLRSEVVQFEESAKCVIWLWGYFVLLQLSFTKYMKQSDHGFYYIEQSNKNYN